MSKILKNFKDSDQVFNTTDKNNIFRSLGMIKYMTTVSYHLVNPAKEPDRGKVR